MTDNVAVRPPPLRGASFISLDHQHKLINHFANYKSNNLKLTIFTFLYLSDPPVDFILIILD